MPVGQKVKITRPVDKPEISLNDLATEKPTLDSHISEVNMQLNLLLAETQQKLREHEEILQKRKLQRQSPELIQQAKVSNLKKTRPLKTPLFGVDESMHSKSQGVI